MVSQAKLGSSVCALLGLAGSMTFADPFPVPAPTGGIYNEATVTGSYNGTPVTAVDWELVLVTEGVPGLTIVKTVSPPTISEGARADRADAGDTVSYEFTVTNDGNVTLANVTPVDPGPTFNGETGTGTLSAFTVKDSDPAVAVATLAPGATETFVATYTLSDLDVYHAADTFGLADDELVVNVAGVQGAEPDGTLYNDPDTDTAKTKIVLTPEIGLVKLATLTDNEDGLPDVADVGETITYTYTVTNLGNVPLSAVTVADIHEAAALTSGTDITSEALDPASPQLQAGTTGDLSTDATPNDGVWDLLQPEDIVVFTYVHTVTQAEVDDG